MATTDRDYADKGWLKLAEPTPFLLRVMVGLTKLSIGITAILAVIAVVRAADGPPVPEWQAFLPLYRRHTDPVNPPRCPSYNSVGESLRIGIAMQSDGGEWLTECRYGTPLTRI